MVASGSLKEGMQRCWGQLALLVIHAQGAPAFSAAQRTAATKIIAWCRDFNVPIFSFDQDFTAMGASVVQPIGNSGLADWAKGAIGTGSTRCYRQWEGNVFADTDLETQLQNRSIRHVVVVGADGATCVKLSAVGCNALQHANPAVQRGATQRGYGVHACTDALLTANEMGLAWLAASDVWAYPTLGL